MLSIVVPTLNEESVLERTLMRIKELQGVPYELIVADSGSTDSTMEIAHRYADITLQYNDFPRNAARGRNLGASKARGDFLVFVDADVLISDINQFFRSALNAFLCNRKLVAIAPRVEVITKTRTRVDVINYKIFNLILHSLNNYLHCGIASGEFQMVLRSAFDKVGGYNEILPVEEDVEFFGRLARIGNVHFLWHMLIMHNGRRQHAIGWPKLWYQWIINLISIKFLGRSWNMEWPQIR